MPVTPDSAASIDPALRAWLTREVGAFSLVGPLIGGITGQNVRIRPLDGTGDLVVRSWPVDGEDHGVRVRREIAGLEALAATDLPVPRLIAADPDGASTGSPTTVTTFLPGQVDLTPADPGTWVRNLAGMLARIHAVPPPELTPCEQWTAEDHAWLDLDPGLAREARALAARPADPAAQVFAHGDYQHFNVLWHEGDVSAVVDWPTAGLADPGLDVGHCRLNIAVLFSVDLAMRFLDGYEELSGRKVDPAADLRRLLNFDASWPRFLPAQVAGRVPVDGPGMAGRMRETVARTPRRAG